MRPRIGSLLPQIGQVLRIRKRVLGSDGHAHAGDFTVEDRYAYTARVIAPLLGRNHLEPGVCVRAYAFVFVSVCPRVCVCARGVCVSLGGGAPVSLRVFECGCVVF